MKRIIFLLILLSGVAFAGSNPTSKAFTLNTTTFTAITADTLVSVGRDIGATTSDSTAWIFSDDEAGTNPVTIPAGKGISYECRKMDQNKVLFWAKASAGTPELSLVVGACRNN